jgi:hypothetical protein
MCLSFLFSGSPQDQLPSDLRGVPPIPKPFFRAQIERALRTDSRAASHPHHQKIRRQAVACLATPYAIGPCPTCLLADHKPAKRDLSISGEFVAIRASGRFGSVVTYRSDLKVPAKFWES